MPPLHAPIWPRQSPDFSSLHSSSRGAKEKLVGIPKGVVIEHRGMEIPDLTPCSYQHIRSRQKNERDILRDDLLRAIVKFLPLRVGEGNHLLLHEGVNFALPGRRRCCLV